MRYLITGLVLMITMPAVTLAENTMVGIGMVNYVGADLIISPLIDAQMDEAPYWKKAAVEILVSTNVAAVGSIFLGNFDDKDKAKMPSGNPTEERLIGVALSAGIDLAVRTAWYIFK